MLDILEPGDAVGDPGIGGFEAILMKVSAQVARCALVAWRGGRGGTCLQLGAKGGYGVHLGHDGQELVERAIMHRNEGVGVGES